jgi:hypothetical protein
MTNDEVKVLLLTGPHGCGKNSLINIYCKEHNIKIIRYKDEEYSMYADTVQEIDKSE